MRSSDDNVGERQGGVRCTSDAQSYASTVSVPSFAFKCLMIWAFMSILASAQIVLLLLMARYISSPVMGAELNPCHWKSPGQSQIAAHVAS